MRQVPNERERAWAQRTPVVLVEDDPESSDRVIVYDRARNRANMTVEGYHATCRLAAGAQVHTLRILP